jgi:hypothetical protein
MGTPLRYIRLTHQKTDLFSIRRFPMLYTVACSARRTLSKMSGFAHRSSNSRDNSERKVDRDNGSCLSLEKLFFVSRLAGRAAGLHHTAERRRGKTQCQPLIFPPPPYESTHSARSLANIDSNFLLQSSQEPWVDIAHAKGARNNACGLQQHCDTALHALHTDNTALLTLARKAGLRATAEMQ